jgi:hypothetical protein
MAGLVLLQASMCGSRSGERAQSTAARAADRSRNIRLHHQRTVTESAVAKCVQASAGGKQRSGVKCECEHKADVKMLTWHSPSRACVRERARASMLGYGNN